MSCLVAAIDDEPDFLHLVSLHLKKAGFDVRGFTDAISFLKYLEVHAPGAVERQS